jgi:hypothetical protein
MIRERASVLRYTYIAPLVNILSARKFCVKLHVAKVVVVSLIISIQHNITLPSMILIFCGINTPA